MNSDIESLLNEQNESIDNFITRTFSDRKTENDLLDNKIDLFKISNKQTYNDNVLASDDTFELVDAIDNRKVDNLRKIDDFKKSHNNLYDITSEYIGVKIFEGIVKNLDGSCFSAVFDNEGAKYSADFDINNLYYEEDMNSIEPGSEILIVIGQKRNIFYNSKEKKYNRAGNENFSKICLRTKRQLTKKERLELDERSKSWAELFK